jgi:hypothetical protein
MDWAERTCNGKLFQANWLATLKALSPSNVHVLGTSADGESADRRPDFLGPIDEVDRMSSVRYDGAMQAACLHKLDYEKFVSVRLTAWEFRTFIFVLFARKPGHWALVISLISKRACLFLLCGKWLWEMSCGQDERKTLSVNVGRNVKKIKKYPVQYRVTDYLLAQHGKEPL